MAQKVKRRKRGRPPRDYSDDPDLHVAELAIALQAAWGLSQRKAFDFALAVHQGKAVPPSKIPRGAKAGMLAGSKLPMEKSFASRNADIRRKLKDGRLRPDARAVLETARLLHRIRRIKV